jgi:hypothetical protein
MYLLVLADRSARQVVDNLTVADLLAVAQGLAHVYRLHEARYETLVFDLGRPCWLPVRPARVAACPDARLHF